MTTTDFTAFVSGHSQFLHPYAISLTSNYEDARDLYQETILRALTNREQYEPGTNLKAWLYTIMRNIFINHYRRNQKLLELENNIDQYFVNGSRTTHNAGWSGLRIGEIKKALHKLPDIFKLSFELYCSGYKYREIADMLNEPLGTVKSRIHFARKMLVTQLDR